MREILKQKALDILEAKEKAHRSGLRVRVLSFLFMAVLV